MLLQVFRVALPAELLSDMTMVSANALIDTVEVFHSPIKLTIKMNLSGCVKLW